MDTLKNTSGATDIEAQLASRGNMINDLEKQIRVNELHFKKRLIELENELRNEQRRSSELHDELMKNLKEQGDYELVKNMNIELQIKLTEHEDLILEQRSKEHSLNSQIRQLKESLKSKNQLPSASSPASSSSSHSDDHRSNSEKAIRQILTTPQMNNASLKGFNASPEADSDQIDSIDKNDLIRAILDLKCEKEGLESEISKIREGAIEAIMEKERIIIELRESIFSESDNSDLLQKIETLHREKCEWEEMHARTVENYERMLMEVHAKLDGETHRFEERLLSIESEINERAMHSFQSNLDSAKDAEHDLLLQLKSMEDRLRFIEKSFSDQTKVLAHMKEAHALQIEENAELKSQLTSFKTQKERILVLEKELLAAERTSKREAESKQETIEKLTRRVNEVLKNCVSLETEAKRTVESLDSANEQVDRLNNELATLQLKLDDASLQYDREIAAIKNRFAEEKRTLLVSQVIPTTMTTTTAANSRSAVKATAAATTTVTPQKFVLRSQSKSGAKKLNGENLFEGSKENMDPRQSSCLKADLGGIMDFNSTFDSPEIGMKKREQQQKQQQQQQQLKPSRLGGGDDDYAFDSFIKQSENSEAVSLLLDSFPLREISTNVVASKIPMKKIAGRNEVNEIAVTTRNGIENNLVCDGGEMIVVSESYEEEFMKLQQELRVAYKQMQDYRRSLAEHISSSNERECALKCELESLKTHIYKIETHMITYKLQYEEDNNFLKEELRITERIAAESKVQVASLAQDKDYFHQKYKNLLAQSKGWSKIKDSSSQAAIKQKDIIQHQNSNFIVF